jgi:predicted restriction endonuclease
MSKTVLDQQNIEQIYKELIEFNYSLNDIQIYFLIKYNINITEPKYGFIKQRMGQEEFRQNLIQRYNSKCILTNSSIFEACHIVPHFESNNMDIDNGLLLNLQHHKMFDDYIWSINPETLNIEINNLVADSNDLFIQIILNKNLSFLSYYPNTIKYLSKHYEIFLQKDFN